MTKTKADVTREQADAIGKALFPGMNYLFRLMSRMEKLGFKESDLLYAKVCAAYDAMHRLSVEVHYLSCGWKPPVGEKTEESSA